MYDRQVGGDFEIRHRHIELPRFVAPRLAQFRIQLAEPSTNQIHRTAGLFRPFLLTDGMRAGRHARSPA
jgi:hypothetical protein